MFILDKLPEFGILKKSIPVELAQNKWYVHTYLRGGRVCGVGGGGDVVMGGCVNGANVMAGLWVIVGLWFTGLEDPGRLVTRSSKFLGCLK